MQYPAPSSVWPAQLLTGRVQAPPAPPQPLNPLCVLAPGKWVCRCSREPGEAGGRTSHAAGAGSEARWEKAAASPRGPGLGGAGPRWSPSPYLLAPSWLWGVGVGGFLVASRRTGLPGGRPSALPRLWSPLQPPLHSQMASEPRKRYCSFRDCHTQKTDDGI